MNATLIIKAATIAIMATTASSCTGTPDKTPGEVTETPGTDQQQPVGDVDNFIRNRYHGCIILDHDWDNGHFEVKIRHNGEEKIVLFDGSRRWIRTLWEIRREQLPEAVINGMLAEGFANEDIDDNDNQVVDTADGLFYAVQARRWNDDFIFLVSSGGAITSHYTADQWDDGRIRNIDTKGPYRRNTAPSESNEKRSNYRNGQHKHSGEAGQRHKGRPLHDDGEDHFDEGDDEWDTNPNP